ncbi:DUF4244 domain-containing protein [Nakamurella deserti]|uniref:DUF4244 domain-containing protein n=1 Tax=Nakamurella deserti TaxID=2164074 RepID=UPI000DBE18BC|nr:DUF4244 domain-containing protein [Nakamurella deserti]
MTHPLTVQDTLAAGPAALATEAGHTPVAVNAGSEHPEPDAGMSTVEYAVGTVVAAAFAAVLYRIVTGDSIVAGLTSLVQSALNTGF